MLTRVGKWIFVLLLGCFIFSCAPTKKAAYLRTGDEVEEINSVDKTYFIDNEYPEIIKKGDELYINVSSGDAEPNSFDQDMGIGIGAIELYSYIVDDEGCLRLPYLKRFQVEGLTINEAVDSLEAELSQYMNLPSVSIRFVLSRISILGEVNAPGLYVFNRKSINIFQAIAYAGDITTFGNRKKVMIVRQEGSEIQRKHVDLTNDKIINSSWYTVKPNDIIYIEPLARKKWGMETFPWGIVFTVVGATTAMITFMLTTLY